MSPGPRTKSSHRLLFLCGLFVAMLLAACGTLQVDLAPTPAPPTAARGPLTPTPNFDKPQYKSEAGVMFDDRLMLVGYTVEPQAAGPGSPLTVTLIWQVKGETEANYNSFVHILNDDEHLVAQSDAPIGAGLRSSAGWIINEYIYDQHHLQLPAGMAAKDVEIQMGLYDAADGMRLDVESPNTYILQAAATPEPEEQAAGENAAGSTDQSSDAGQVNPSQTPADTASGISAPKETEIPQIEEPGAGSDREPLDLRVAYVKNGDVWIWEKSSGLVQLTLGGGVEDVWLSDDGEYIAFTRDQEIWVIDSEGGTERQLAHEDDFQDLSLDPELEPFITSIRPAHVAWRPDSHELYFNTSPQMEGPGLFLSDDLWVVDVDSGELSMALAPGEGGNFYFSPDGRSLAIITPGRIDLMAADVSSRREAFTHTPVITFSEFEYYSEPVWGPDSSSLRVAIPPADQSAVDTGPTSIWHIPVEDRPARMLGQVTILPGLPMPPLFAPDLARLAYLSGGSLDGDPGSQRPDIAVSELGENNIWDPTVFPAEAMSVYDWSPDGMRLLYRSSAAPVAEITMGQPVIKTVISGDDQDIVLDLSWVDSEQFLYLRNNPSGWDILLGRDDGSSPVFIDSTAGPPIAYDFALVPAKKGGQS